MSAQAGGAGTASDATIDTGAITAEELAERQRNDYQVLVDAVPKGEEKIKKLQDQLAGAKESLANAKAALAGATAPEGK